MNSSKKLNCYCNKCFKKFEHMKYSEMAFCMHGNKTQCDGCNNDHGKMCTCNSEQVNERCICNKNRCAHCGLGLTTFKYTANGNIFQTGCNIRGCEKFCYQ